MNIQRAARTRRNIDQYPTLLAAPFARKILPLLGFEIEQASQFHQNLKDLAEVITKYLAVVALAQYRQDTRQPGRENQSVETVLRKLREPSLGHWRDLLRETLNLYATTDHKLLSDLYNFYYSRTLAEDSPVSIAIDRIQRWIGRTPLLPSPFHYSDFFEVLPQYRNKGAHGAAFASDEEYKEHVDFLFPALERMLNDLKFLTGYPLIYIRRVNKQEDSDRVQLSSRAKQDRPDGSHPNARDGVPARRSSSHGSYQWR